MSEPPAPPRDGPWLTVAGVAVVGSSAAAIAAQRVDGWAFWLLIAMQLVFTLAAFAIPECRVPGSVEALN